MIILAFSLFGMAFSIHSLSISLLLLLGIGLGAALIGVPMQTIIQETTPEEMRGKVFGLQNNLVNIALSLTPSPRRDCRNLAWDKSCVYRAQYTRCDIGVN